MNEHDGVAVFTKDIKINPEVRTKSEQSRSGFHCPKHL